MLFFFFPCALVHFQAVLKASVLNVHFRVYYLVQIERKEDVLVTCHQISHGTSLDLALRLPGHEHGLL